MYLWRKKNTQKHGQAFSTESVWSLFCSLSQLAFKTFCFLKMTIWTFHRAMALAASGIHDGFSMGLMLAAVNLSRNVLAITNPRAPTANLSMCPYRQQQQGGQILGLYFSYDYILSLRMEKPRYVDLEP